MVFTVTWCIFFLHPMLVFPSPTRAVGDETLLREPKDVRDSAMSQWNAALLEVTVSRQELTAQLATHGPDHPTIAPLRQRAIMAIEAVTRAEERFSTAEGAVIRVLESINTVASSSCPAPQDRKATDRTSMVY